MNHLPRIILASLPVLLMSCGGGSSGTESSSPQMDDDGQTDITAQTRLDVFSAPFRALSDSLDPSPSRGDDGAYLYSFETDAGAELSLAGDPGTVTLTSFGSVINLPADGSSTPTRFSWESNLDIGSWEVRYDPENVADSESPLIFLEFPNSSYSLYDEISSRLIETGRELLLRASIVSDSGIGDTSSVDYFGLPQAPEQASILHTHSLTTFVDGEFVTNTVETQLSDDGNLDNGDLIADDGVYSAIVFLTNPGTYLSSIFADTTLNGSRVQRNSPIRVVGLSQFRALLASSSTQAIADNVFDPEVSDQGHFVIPVPLNFTSAQVPFRIDASAELWATDSEGQQVLVDNSVGVTDDILTDGGDGTHIVPMFLERFSITGLSAQYTDYRLRDIRVQSSDDGHELLFATREIAVTGLLE